MVLSALFKPRPAVDAGRRLYAAAARQARSPAFYRDWGVPDTNEGRFELYTLHVVLLLRRLRGEGAEAAETAQAVFDAYLKNLDDGLREMGVADLRVGKKMRKLGEAAYGRIRSYDHGFDALPDAAELEAVLGRTLFAGVPAAPVAPAADYAQAALRALQTADLSQLYEGEPPWPPITP